MPDVLTKFTDYRIQSVEYFIDHLNTELAARDIPGLLGTKVESIRVSKQHPLAILMAAILQPGGADPLRSGLIPAIGITPGNLTDEGMTLGQTYKSERVDDTFIEELEEYSGKTSREILNDLMITQKQIDLIKDTYDDLEDSQKMLCQITEWRKNEEINISVWSDTADIDIILGNLMDSIMADMQVGFYGDDSLIMNLKYRITKGLTNFNYGRVLYGSEYSVTFTNTFKNYQIFVDTIATEHDFIGEFNEPD